MAFSRIGAAAVIPALIAGYLGLATSAQAEFCPPDVTFASQQDGVCVTDVAINPGNPTRVLFQTSAETAPQEVFIGISGIPLLPGFNAGILFLTEPAGTPSEDGLAGLLPGVIVPLDASDALALRISTTVPGTIDIGFISDGALPAGIADFNDFAAGLPLVGSIVETGAWQDVSAFFGVPAGSAFVQSDVETVPEPASLALLGAALIGFAAIRRRKQV